MKNPSKLKFSALCVLLASTYAVDGVSEQFNVTPSIAQELNDAIAEQSGFLSQINIMPVDDIQGEKVSLGANVVAGKRTNTDSGERETSDLLSLGSKTYQLIKTEYDVHIKFSSIDSWAKFPNFNTKYSEAVRKAMAVSRLKTGWIGTSAPAFTSANDFTDTNIGWLQHLRNFDSGSQVLVDGAASGVIKIGAGGDYLNLDSAVHDARQLVHKNFRNGTDLVVLVGSDLVAEEKARLYALQSSTPTEKTQIESIAVNMTYGGLKAITPDQFPERGLLITSLDNLSIYYQDTSQRRSIISKDSKDRVEDFNSVNEGYVVENELKAAMIDFTSIQLPDGEGGWS
jgi:P2 family phage major capsid protein